MLLRSQESLITSCRHWLGYTSNQFSQKITHKIKLTKFFLLCFQNILHRSLFYTKCGDNWVRRQLKNSTTNTTFAYKFKTHKIWNSLLYDLINTLSTFDVFRG